MGQLVLSRKPGERIFIGENVTLTIVRIGPNTVRLGVEAPREMNIVREELTVPPAGVDAPKPKPVTTTKTKERRD